MRIDKLIAALQRFEQSDPDTNVSICLDVSLDGVLANNNFILHDMGDWEAKHQLVLIAPSQYDKGLQLLKSAKGK